MACSERWWPATRSMHRTSLAFAVACALAGCGSGCDGERRKLVDAPRSPRAPADAAAAELAAPPAAAALTAAAGAGFLDAPPGSLDPLFVGPRRRRARPRRPRGRPGVARPVAVLRRLAHRRRLDDLAAARHAAEQVRRRRARAGRRRPPADAALLPARRALRDAPASGRPSVGGHSAATPSRSASPGCGSTATKQGRAAVGRDLRRLPGRDQRRPVRDPVLRRARSRRPALPRRRPAVAAARDQDRARSSRRTRRARSSRSPTARTSSRCEHGGGGAIDLFGVVLERLRPGVIVDSLGVVGRRLGSLRSWDWSVIGEQLATRDPRLVVLQYGTNEADDPDLDLEAIGALLRRDHPADPRGRADRVDPDPRPARHGRARGRQAVRPDEARSAAPRRRR